MTVDGCEETKEYPAHVRNAEIAASWRYGLVALLLATLALLLASDLGGGVTALTQTVPDENLGISFQSKEQILLDASVFTSVGELWKAGSKPLAIFVVFASIAWPYIKLLLTLYAWVTPIRHAKRRERLLSVLDLLGKWSFADFVVFSVIMVVFRETIPIGAGYLEVWIKPQWGLFGFVSASMLSLSLTHVVLYYHRKVVYKVPPQNGTPRRLAEHAHLSNAATAVLTLLLLISFAAYLMGSILRFFRVKDVQAGMVRNLEEYSFVRIGKDLPNSGRDDENNGGLIYLQIVWFLLGVIIPLWSILSFLWLLLKPMTVSSLRNWLLLSEVFLSWSCGEVFLISTVLAIKEIPTFGDGLIDTGCSQCYTVDTRFLTEIASLVVGTSLSLLAGLTLLHIAHKAAYDPKGDTVSDAGDSDS